eukprot:PLAT6971.1.p1 GENE.PLAT6971.1~~PLAT6971.1.p1  ORF type:complete len:894 (+),score=532.56 PLAT6971.1:35-2716(+)
MSKEEDEIEIGSTVLVLGRVKGEVAWLGEYKETEWVGVKLVKPLGKSDGTFDGVRRFTTRPNYAAFVRLSDVKLYSDEEHAAHKMGGAAKRMLAKRKVKAAMNSRAWNTLDSHEELLTLERGRKFMEHGHHLGSKREEEEAASPSEGKVTDPDYDGPHIAWPLDMDTLLDLLDAFKERQQLHYKYGLQVLTRFHRVVADLPTLVELSLPEGVKLTVIGDLHGQLPDLFTIFTINGLPSDSNWYLFNGDFVDRGDCGMEISMLLFCFKLLFPDYVHINRGNHECRTQNSWMGFEAEILGKYGGSEDSAGRQLLASFHSTFDALPLMHVVQKRILVLHGGLFDSPSIELSQLKAVRRKREPPIRSPAYEDRLMEQILWSDPRPCADYPAPLTGAHPSDRGAGVVFGADVTKEFCRVNRLSLVIRSHECVQEGFEVLHNGKLITIFSASRYCGTQTNKGAFISFGSDLQPEIQQFYAHSLKKASFRSEESAAAREKKLEDDTVRMIVDRICDCRADLFWYFTQMDSDHDGKVTRLEWAVALRNVLKLDLPYLSYQARLVELDGERNVNYARFLERYRIHIPGDTSWQEAVIEQVCRKLLSFAHNVDEAFAKFDVNEDGLIEYEEFSLLLQKLDLGLTPDQIFELMASVDSNSDSQVDLAEFRERFAVVFTRVTGEGSVTGGRTASESLSMDGSSSRGEGGKAEELPEVDAWTMRNLNDIGTALLTASKSVKEVFAAIDVSGDGLISIDEFSTALEGLGMSYTPEEVAKLASVIDTDGDGNIDLDEFSSMFAVVDRASDDVNWQLGIVHSICNTLYQHRRQLQASMRVYDTTGGGRVRVDDFHRVLDVLGPIFERPLTDFQVAALCKTLDRDGDGFIDYNEFLEGMRVRDMAEEAAE